MSNDYRIGLSQGSLVSLVDDPYPVLRETDIAGFTLSGSPINVAMETITWKWKNMSQSGFYQLYLFWATNIEASNPAPYVYIRSLSPVGGTFQYNIYRCKMGKPSDTTEATLAEIRDCEIKFYQCEMVA